MSPIKGVSEIIRLKRRGKIRLGARNASEVGNDYPVATDYFVCPEEVRKVFGERPKELRIMFPTENPAHWAAQFLRCYSSARRLVCRGDGQAAVARVDEETGRMAFEDDQDTLLKEIACDPGSCIYYQTGRCRRVMNLQFLLPDLPGLDVYQLDSGSFNSIVNINTSLEVIGGACGRLSMIPLYLRLVEETYQRNGHTVRVYVLHLEARFTFSELQRFAQVPSDQLLVVPPPDSEAPDDLAPVEALREGQVPSGLTREEKELIKAWDQAKKKVWQFNVLNSQLARWFLRNYHIDVTLDDFESPLPPRKFSAESLTHFCRAVERSVDEI